MTDTPAITLESIIPLISESVLEVFPPHAAGLTLDHNPHLGTGHSVEEFVASVPVHWVNEMQEQKAVATGEFWMLQWYPKTPTAFFRIGAADLKDIFAFCLQEKRNAEETAKSSIIKPATSSLILPPSMKSN